MKLKKLFSAKKTYCRIFAVLSLLLFFSCTSASLSVPVPGQGAAKTRNIYAEYYNLGDSYFKLESYYKLAKCYVYQSKWGDAQTAYETMLKRDPENTTIQSSVAYIYAMNGNIDKSLEIYKDLIEKIPESPEVLENYICVLLADEQKDEASIQYDILKEKFPESKRLEELGKQFESAQAPEESETAEQAENPDAEIN